MKAGVALLTILAAAAFGFTACASAGEACPPAAPPSKGLSGVLGGVGAVLSPEIYEQQQHQLAVRAIYDALLAAGAPESLACAAALNPDFLRSVAPIYFGRKDQ